MAALTVGPSGYPNIEAAIDAASQGDTIELSPGYSDETVTVTKNYITIVGGSSSQNIALVIGNGVSGLVLSGEALINVTDSSGDDTVSGNAGDNVITVTGGSDVVNGGSGEDRLVVDYSATTAAVTGTTTTIGSDKGTVTVTGSSIEHYTVSTGSGIDTLTFLDGDNVIDAGTTGGNTITVGSGNNTIISGSGIDGIIVGNGDNYIDAGTIGANTITVGPTGSGNNTIISGSGIDGIIAGNGDNYIDAGTIGANTITAGSGNNTIISGSGIDGITVGTGNNYIEGGDGANTITAGPTGFGNNTILSGSGIDTISVGNGDNCIDAGTGGANTITAGSGNNTIISGSGIDGFTVGDGDNYIDSGEGANTIAVGHGNNTILSGSGIDTITAGNGNNNIEGGEGANAITTGTGNDVVSSGISADTIVTGAGNDIVKDAGGAGAVAAGAGHDRLVMDFSTATTAVTNTVTGADSHGGVLGGTTYTGVEEFHITTGSGNDTLLGGDGADVLDGGAGADSLSAGGGSDVIYGGIGDVVDGGEVGSDFDVLVLKDFGDHRIDLDNLLDPESGTVVQLDDDGNETGSVAFTGIESIEFVDNTVTTQEDTLIEDGRLFTATPTTTVTSFVVGSTTYVAGQTAFRTEGDLTINSDGGYTFTPAPNYNGPGPVTTYTTVDAVDPLNSGTSSLKIDVASVDEIHPVCVLDETATDAPTVSITEDTDNDGLISGAESSGQVDVTIELPAETLAGDTLTITSSDPTAPTQTVELTDDHITTGVVLVDYDAPAHDDTITVSAVITDAAGNTSAAGSDSATLDLSAAASITLDTDITPDNIINAAEAGAIIAITGTTAGDVAEADTVTLTVNNTLYTGPVAADGSFSINVAGSDLANDTAIDASVTTTDAAGNTATATDAAAYFVNTAAPNAPTVSIAEDTDNDGLISGAESSGQVDVTIELPAETLAGDTLTITSSDPTAPTQTVELTDDHITTGVVLVDYDAPAHDDTITVSAVITDAAGNTSAAGSDSATLDLSAAASITLDTDITPDNIINAAEAGAITGTTAGDVAEADTVTLTVNNTLYTGPVAADGSFSINVAGSDLANDTAIDASVTTTDAAGNTATATDAAAYFVNTAAPNAPTVSIAEDTDNDGLISGAESSGQVDVTIELPAETLAGDTLTITSSDPTAPTQTVELTDDHITTGVVLVDYDAPAHDDTITVSAVITDAAGNTSAAGSDSATLDLSAAASITLDTDITPDNIINAAEAGAIIAITGTTAGDVAEADTVTLTVNNTLYTGPVAADGSFSINVAGSDLANDTAIDASVTTTDAAGNTATATDAAAYFVNTAAPNAPTVSIAEDTDNDGLISGAESSGQVDVTIELPAETLAGDTLTITSSDPTAPTQTVELTDDHITTGVVLVDYDAPAHDDTITVSAVITDAAGNTSAAGSDSATLDLSAAASITLDTDITPDNIINAAEAGAIIAITGTTAGDVAEADTVTLTVNNTLYTGPVAADGSFSINVAGSDLANDTAIDASVTTTDAAGNTATATDAAAYFVNTAAPNAPTVSIAEDTDNDGLISGAESSGQVDVTIELPAETLAGDTLTITSSDPTAPTQTVELTDDHITTGVVLVDYDAPAHDDTITVSAVITDAAGNTSAAGSDSATLDLSAAASITLDTDITPDNIINAAEAGAIIAITGTTAGDVAEADTVTLTVNNTLYTGPVAADGSFSINVAGSDLANDTAIDASVTTTDAAGNTATATDAAAYFVNTAAPNAPTVSIAEDTDNDGLISGAESSGQVDVTIELPAETLAGDTLTITSSDPTAPTQTVELTDDHITTGVVLVDYDAPAHDDTITVSAVITDAAGNTSAAGSDSAGVVCFAEGTLITTAGGEIPIEDLQVGDLIQTLDSGLQPLRWIGRRHLDAHKLAESDNLRPIRISHNVIGHENCDRDLVVSPQHRILIASRVAERMFGSTEVIVAAKHLLAIEGVDIATDLKHVTYFHILLDEHAIVYANKVPAESLYLGHQAQLSLSAAGRAEIFALFPEVASPSFIPTSCRPIIGNKRARKLAQRHIKNNKPFIRPQNWDHQSRLPQEGAVGWLLSRRYPYKADTFLADVSNLAK
ncbi:metalloprotease domain-containing protein [Octadecabacter antarcticus 307]|uniref:Metalloprotease domain-containing protein n=1 Tax=Octadecabacter antarcticus 307 TaxID=391626 RepID=M9R3K0_9RHOB|nr:Ig-like domain-containing protein [Octadecabacter antarcticus]AGI66802.1 metalloprotease domain-containing protein [Octadecabacter antarcticus 307]